MRDRFRYSSTGGSQAPKSPKMRLGMRGRLRYRLKRLQGVKFRARTVEIFTRPLSYAAIVAFVFAVIIVPFHAPVSTSPYLFGVLICVAPGLVPVLLGVLHEQRSRFERKLREDLIEPMIRKRYPELSYQPKAGFPEGDFLSSRLCLTVPNYRSQDLVERSLPGGLCSVAEINNDAVSFSYLFQWTTKRLVFIQTSLNVRLDADLIFVPRFSKSDIHLRGRADLGEVKLDRPEMDRRYTLLSMDPHAASYVVSSGIPEKLLEFEALRGQPVYMSVIGLSLSLALPLDAPLFGVGLKGPLDLEVIERSVFTVGKLFERTEELKSLMEASVHSTQAKYSVPISEETA